MEKKIIITYESDHAFTWVRVVEECYRYRVQYRWSDSKDIWQNHLRRGGTATFSSKNTAISAARRLFLNRHPCQTFTYKPAVFQKITHGNVQAFRKWFRKQNGYWPIMNNYSYWLVPKKEQAMYVKMKWGC